MRLLVLGGTRFVGRAVVADALVRGWDVTALHRGLTGSLPEAVAARHADRTDEAALAAALGDARWDLVVDTWAGAPRVAGLAARLLRGRTDGYGLVSSASVYVWGAHTDESSPLVEADPDAEETDYAADKRGGELAVLAHLPNALLARAGLLLGPYEDVGRMPWWLGRTARGGPFVAPGRPERPLQLLDVRDLARWLLDALERGASGPYDVTGPSGAATTRSLLAACVDVTGGTAVPVWVDEQVLDAAGVQPWVQLPCWVPERGEFAGPRERHVAGGRRRSGLPARGADRARHLGLAAGAGVAAAAAGAAAARAADRARGPAPAYCRRVMTDREQLLALVRAQAVVHGQVTLSSGREADYYVDLRRITLSGEAAPLVGRVMRELTAGLDYDAVGGLTMGADPVAAAMLHAAAAQGLRLDAFVVRKEAKAHGLQRRVEGPDVAGRRVLVVEDTSTTGSSPLTALQAVREAGAVPVGVAVIADRDTGAQARIEAEGVPYLAAYALADLGLS